MRAVQRVEMGTDQRECLAGPFRLYSHGEEQGKAGPSLALGNMEKTAARRNSSLQGAYLILAARALGLDCGPMSGFDNAKLDDEFFGAGKECEGCEQEFFPSGHVKSNFLCNLGYGDREKLLPRSPRLEYNEACTLL